VAAPQPEEHLRAYAHIQRAADREILAALKEAYRDVGRQLSALGRSRAAQASLERQRLLAIKKAILEAQAEFYDRAGKVIERRRVEAAARAIQVSGRYDEAAFSRAGRTEDLRALSESLEETEARAPDALVARLTGSRVPLSERVYRTQAYTQGLLDRRINSALARGLNAEQFAREVRDLVDPNTPGGVRFAALRLARSEINNAYHAMAIRAAELKPWVTGMEWHTSDSHVRPDECDRLNKEVFSPPENTPRKPHPQCMCYVTQVIGDPEKSDEENDDDFLDDLVGGLFDDDIDRLTSGQPEGTVAPAKAIPAPAKKAVKKAAPAKAAKKAPAKKVATPAKKAAAPVAREETFVVPHINNVPAGEHAQRLLPDNAVMRRELDLQEAITPQSAGQLFNIQLVGERDLGAGTGGLHNRQLRVIQIAMRSSGPEDRTVYNKAEANGFHPACGREHSTDQLHLAHEYGHHVHHMLDFMPMEQRIDLWNAVADSIGVPHPAAPAPGDDFPEVTFEKSLKFWMLQNRNAIERQFGRYATNNDRELMAEIWSAYSTNPDTKNQAIKKIGPIMRRLAEAGAVRGQVSRPDEDAKRLEALADKLKKAMEQGLL
jgi:hypothetical protein